MVGFLDELWSGVAVVAAPAVERDYRLDHASYTLFIFAAPTLLAALVEAALALASDRIPRRVFLVGGLLALALTLAASAASPWPWLLSLGLAAAGAASGSACGAAQASLVEAQPDAPERAMTRWTLLSALGDTVTPPLVALFLATGRSYRAALLVAAALAAAHALALLRATARPDGSSGAPPPAAAEDDEEAEAAPLRQALREASRRPALWAWLFGSATCALLDEIVVALAALRMRSELGASETSAVAWTAAYCAGTALGAAATERLLARASPRAVLAGSALASALCLLVTLRAPSVAWMLPALFVLGATVAPHYPIAKARAFSMVPGAPGIVNGLAQVFVALDIAAPIVIGLVANRHGLGLALGCLLLQPLTLLALAWRWPRAEP